MWLGPQDSVRFRLTGSFRPRESPVSKVRLSLTHAITIQNVITSLSQNLISFDTKCKRMPTLTVANIGICFGSSTIASSDRSQNKSTRVRLPPLGPCGTHYPRTPKLDGHSLVQLHIVTCATRHKVNGFLRVFKTRYENATCRIF